MTRRRRRAIRLTGTEHLAAALQRLRDRAPAAVEQAVRDEAEAMLNAARADLARQSLLYHLTAARDRRLI